MEEEEKKKKKKKRSRVQITHNSLMQNLMLTCIQSIMLKCLAHNLVGMKSKVC